MIKNTELNLSVTLLLYFILGNIIFYAIKLLFHTIRVNINSV